MDGYDEHKKRKAKQINHNAQLVLSNPSDFRAGIHVAVDDTGKLTVRSSNLFSFSSQVLITTFYLKFTKGVGEEFDNRNSFSRERKRKRNKNEKDRYHWSLLSSIPSSSIFTYLLNSLQHFTIFYNIYYKNK